MQTQINTGVDIYTVSRINNEVRFLLEESYHTIWVEGRNIQFAAPHSGLSTFH